MKKRKNRDSSAWCSACSSSKKKNPERSFHSFPKDLDRCNLWIQKCNLQHLEERTAEQLKYCRLCSEHFDEKSFSGNRLAADAIPTKNLLRPKDIFPTLKKLLKEKLSRDDVAASPLQSVADSVGGAMVKKCCVPGCSSKNTKEFGGMSLFQFPSDEERRQVWMNSLKFSRVEGKSPRQLVVCQLHFEDWCFTAIGATGMKRRLIRSAVPKPTSVEPLKQVEVEVEVEEPVLVEVQEPSILENIQNRDVVPVPRVKAKLPTEDFHNDVPTILNVLNCPQNIQNRDVVPAPGVNAKLPTEDFHNDVPTILNVLNCPQNMQNKDVVPEAGVKAKLPTEDFHNDVPTILNVFNYPQEKWAGDLRPLKPLPAIHNLREESIYCAEKCKQCKYKYWRVLDRNKKLTLEVQKLRKENSQLSKYDLKLLNKTQRSLVEGMFRRKQVMARGYRYDPNLLNDTMKLRQISRQAYLFVKKHFHLPIPSEASIRKYLAEMRRMVEGGKDNDRVSGDEGPVVQEVNFDEVDDTLFGNEGPVVQEDEVDDALVVALEVDAVEVVSSNLAEDGQTQMDVDVNHTGIVPSPEEVEMVEVMSSYSGDDAQVPRVVDIDQTRIDVRTSGEVEPAEVVSSNCGAKDQTPLKIDLNQTSSMSSSVVSSNSGSDAQVPLDVDQTCSVLAPSVSSDPGSDGRVPLEVSVNQTCNVPAPVEVVSSKSGTNVQVPLQVDHTVLAPSVSSDSGNDGRVPLKVSVNQTCNVPAPVEVVSSNSSTNVQVPLQVATDQIYRLVAPLGVVTTMSGEQFFVIPTD